MRKYIYHIASLISLLMLSFCGFAQNGTPANPYPIQGKTALITFAECINTGQKFSFENGEFVFNPNGDIPAHGAGTYFEQTADIDLDGEAWVTIGNSLSTGFRGTYIGGGYKIQHLTLTANNPAMFLYPSGTIQNLTIENPVFNGSINYGGALATFVMGGTIDNCHVTGNNLVFNGKDCGALIGWVGVPNGDKAGEVTISHCSNSCNITSHYQQESFTDYYNSVAGVVACIKAERYHVAHCFNTGNITSTYRPVFQKDTLCFAGVVGRGYLPTHTSEITYCYNTGDITAHCGYLGGVAGFFNEEVGVTNYTRCAIDYCFNTGNITGIPVFHVDNPTAYVYADTNLDVFSLGGVVAPSKTKTRFCFNTGNVTLRKHPHPRFVINGEQGVAGVGSSAEHCFNVGEITNYNLRNGRAAGVSRDTANHCFNAACVDDRNPRYTFSPHNISQVTISSASDAQMSVDGQDGNLYCTAKLMGQFSAAKNSLGDEYWIYEVGRYPRLKWTDTCVWARDIVKVACTPIVLADTVDDIRHVKNGIQFFGCDSGVVWKAPADNCLFDDQTLAHLVCNENTIVPQLMPECREPVIVAATWNGDTIKTVTLLRSVPPSTDTLTVDSLGDLRILRDGVNTAEAFFYKHRYLPRYAEGVAFKLTIDLDMQNERPWESIGSVFSGSRFSGTFLGDGHIIDNLSLDDDSVYFFRNSSVGGLFGMLSGEVRDLRFTNIQADSTVIVAGAVCALMNGGTIENCVVEGRIETTTSNNNFAISGIAGIAGVSLTAHTQDNTLTCRDIIRNCVNYADIITHVRRGTNIASHSAGGIIGHGGVVINCANAGDISGGAECGYIGGIGGDLTTALRCFNTGRISIAKSPQSIDYYVGGVVGINGYPHTVQYCYNAGPVDGSDRNHVGGIMGEGSPEYCYLSNTVTSTGKHLGSITASSPNSPTHCYYDNQMSPIGGMDSEGSIEGRATTAMLGTALQNKLGVDTNWTFTEGLYPRLTSLLTLNSQLSTVSAMPVLLDADQTWATAHDNFSMGGCDEHHFWKKIRGSVDVNGCNIFPGAHPMGVLEFAATYDSVPYRHITLKYNLDEAHALIIKNADEFNNMRKVINNAGGGYYRFDDNTFHLTVPTGDYIDVKDGGNERFFKLIGDIDLSSRDWIPIGGFEESCCDLYRGTPFKGTFDGCGHTIRNLKILWVNGIDTCNRYQGLFGTIDGGTVKNLRITQNDENKSISNSAFLCAVNRGTLYNCEIDSCELTVAASKYSTSLINMDTVSLLCGVNDGGLIDSCRVKNSQIVINENKSYSYSVLGGVCGLNKQGTIQDCRVENLHFEDLRKDNLTFGTPGTYGTQAVGSICGINFHGQLLHDTIKNSRFLFSASLEHQNIGGICGINGNDDKNENRYTDIPSIVENCLSDSTIIKCDTCIQGSSSCQKMAMNFGGIVGMSQGHIVQINSCATTAGSRLEVAADSVGGICGNFIGLGDESLISNCNNTAPVKGYGYVGGIVGLVTNAILVNNHNTGNVWSAWDATFGSQSGRPSGYYAGGIAGACIRRVVAMTCSNKAKIKADSSYVGGIVGALLDSCELIDCANKSVNDNEPDVIGINQVGGLVGLLGQDAWFGDGCENHGTVKGVAQVGGLVGFAKTGNVETRLIASLQCEGHNDGTVQGSSMSGCVYGYAEDPSLFEACTSNPCQASPHTYPIDNENDLIAVRNAVNDGSNSYEGWTILLNEDLSFGGTNWIPIGTPEHPFRGTFDGQNHTVHFHINAPDSNYRGFFGYMQGTVINLYLDNCSVIGHDYVGGIAGFCHGTIAYCGTKASCVANSKVSGNKYVGGLVGMARYSEIFYNQNGSNVSGNQYVGGIVGDYVAYKNDNSYGKLGPAAFGASQYDIYGGYVSRCFNFGMVKATNDDSYVGGIAGSTSTEVNHSYNSGIVDGKDKVGGIAGQLQGDSIHHCYNTGYVSATGTHKGAICGSTLNSQLSTLNFYDRQMCTVEDANATARYTREMTGEKLKSVLGNDYWTYQDNEYPKIKYWDDIHSDAAVVSVKPLLLPGYMPVDDILQNFAGATGNTDVINVVWLHYGNPVDTILHLPGRDTVKLNNCGMDTLAVQFGNPCEHRLVPIKVTGKNALVTTDTACTSYTWQVGDTTYTLTESGFYTVGEDCYHQYALNLTVANISCDIEQIGSTCETIPDGALMSTVTGGFGNGFRYKWVNMATNDSIGNLASITNLVPGTYSLTVTDSAVTHCAFTEQTALEMQPTVALTIAGCSESKPYDGTALTGTRFVVREEGRAPDTIVANKFAVLSNGDTVLVTLASGSVTTFGTLSDTVIIKSYTIKNGIDHSCHYSVTTDSGSLSITKRPVLIKVDDASKDFGDPDPDFSGTVTGLVNAGDIGEITYRRKHPGEEAIKTYVDELTADATNMNNPNYEVAIDEGEFIIHCRSLAKLSKWFPDVTNINDCFSPTNTDTLPSASDIKKMIADSNNIDINAITVTTRDSVLSDDNCNWKWARIYSISANISNNNSGFCDVESRVLFVSGGDQSAPVRSINYLWIYGTVYQDACLASFDIDKFFPQDVDLFYDCSQMTITHKDTNTGDDHYGWTIRRSYVVTDACGHTIYDTIEVSGRDQTPPVASNSKVKNNTLWADSAQCLCDSIHVINDFDSLKTLFGLSDECTGNDISLVSKTRTFKTGNCCADTVVVAYTVADPYGNAKTFYHAQFIQDTTRPTFDIVPKDIALCLLGPGLYKETVYSVIYDEHNQVINRVANIHDNCTKLQGSFVVHDSIDLDNYTVVNGIRQYEQYWTVTDSCGNVDTNKMIIKVNPLPTIRIDTLGTQTIFYGEQFQDITINNEYSVVSLTPSDRGLVYSEGKVTGWLDSVGTYSYTATATSNQTPSCGSVDTVITIDVNPRPITIAAGSATKKYDGTPLTSPYYECTVIPYPNMQQEASILNVDSIASVTIIGSQIDVGSSANVPSNAVITRRTDASVNMNSSYDVTYANGTLTVTTNDTLIKVIPADGTKVYDGTPLTKTAHDDFTVTGVPEGLTWEATADGKVTNVTPGEGEKAVNAVTSFKIKDADGHDVTTFFTNIQDSIGTLTITPRSLTITAASDTKVYDGTTLTKNSYTHSDLAPGDSLWSVTVTGSQTIAGNSDNVPSAAVIKNAAGDTVTANYNITYENGTLEVTQKPLTITAGDSSKVYDGSFLTKNSYTHTDLAAGDSLWSVTIEGKALYLESSNVPSDAVIKNAAGDTVTKSYDITYVNGTLRIIPTKLYLTAGDSTKVYDGTDLTCHTYTCTGLIGNDSIAFKMESVLKYADTISNEITEITIYNRDIVPGKDTLVTNGYDIESQDGTLAVTKKPLTITASDSTKEYDGTPLTKKSYTHSELVPGDSIKTIIIMGSQTVAGSSDNVPEGAHIDNANNDPVTESYNITYVKGTLTVTKKPLTITAASATKEYDGTPLTKNTYTHTPLVAGDSIWSVTVTGSQTLVGTSNNVPSAAVIKNDTLLDITDCYEITYTNGTLEVTPNTSTITVVPSGGSKEYDGTPLTKTADTNFTVTGVPEGFTWTAAADGTVTNVVPGDGEKAVNAVREFKILNAANENVTNQFSNIDTSATDTLIITPKNVTLASGGKTREYNGAALTNAEVDGVNDNGLMTETGWVDGEGATYQFTGSQTFVGKDTNSFSYTLNSNTLASNYNIIKTEDTLEITVNTAAIAITSADGSWMYDGSTHTKPEFTVTYNGTDINAASGSNGLKFKLPTGDTLTVTPTFGGVKNFSDNIPDNNVFTYAIEHQDQYKAANITATYGTLAITANTDPIVITSADSSWMYDGSTHTKPEYTVTYNGTDINAASGSNGLKFELPTGDTLTVTPTFGGVKNFSDNIPNNNVFTYAIEHQDQYTAANITATYGTLAITANTDTIVITSADGSWMYDGSTHTKPEYTVTYNSTDINAASGSNGLKFKLPTGDTLTVIPTFGGVTNFSDNVAHNNVFTYAIEHQNQYTAANIKSTYGTLAITANTAAIAIVSADGSWMYNGSAQTKPEYTVTYNSTDINAASGSNGLKFKLPTGDTLTVNPTFGGIKNFSDNAAHNNVFTYAIEHQSQYTASNIKSTYGTLAITKRDVTLTSNDDSKEYDGTALTNTAVTESGSGFVSGEVSNIRATGTIIEVGSVTNSIVFDAATDYAATNYAITKNEGLLTITPSTKELKVVSANGNWTYDGNAHTKHEYTVTYGTESYNVVMAATATTGTATLSTGDTVTITPAASATITHVAQGDVANAFSFTVKHGDQYSNKTKAEGVLTITPKAVNITVNDASKTYGQGDPTFTGSVEGLLNDNDLGIVEYIRTNSDEEVGTYENVLSATFTTNSNYTVTIDSGNFTINCRNIVEPASWPENITGQNSCFADADTTGLKDAVEIRTLFAICNPVMNESDVTVSAQDDPTKTNDCDWTWTRTYTVSITGGCASVTKTMSVSGGNHRKPSFKVPSASAICPNEDGTYDVNPDITGNVSNVFDYCHSTAQLSIDYSDSEVELMSDGSRRIIRTWTVTDACGNESVQTQVITINPAVEISVTPNLQTIVIEDPITPVIVTSQYYQYITSAISLNNVATSFADAGLEVQETAQGLQVSGTPADTGTYKLLFTAISDQFPVCHPKQAEATIAVRMMQDTVKVVSDTASKFYDGTPLTCHRYVVTLGQDTIPADEGSNGLIFSVHFHDKLVITPVSSLTNAGTIDNEFTCVLDHPEHYKGLKKEFGTLTVNRASLSMSLDTARAYNGHPFVVTADQLHVTGLAENDTITAGIITTEGYIAGTYVCAEGNFQAYVENGVAVKSGFAINHGLNNYEPDFEVTLTIDPITEGFDCPADLHIVLKEGAVDTMLVLTESATVTPMVDNIVISNNLASQNPLPVGTHTILWTLSDDQDNVMTTCEQTVTVEYAPCVGVTYHDHAYAAKRIGSQCWFTENLSWATGNYSAYHEDDANVEKFGYLYSWYTAVGVDENDDTAMPETFTDDCGHPYVQGICPAGWGIGSMADYELLNLYAESTSALKDMSTEYWQSGYEGTLPNTGFRARGGGWYNSVLNRYEDLMTGYHFWRSDSTPGSTAFSSGISYWCADIVYSQSRKTDRKSVRCIRKVIP